MIYFLRTELLSIYKMYYNSDSYISEMLTNTVFECQHVFRMPFHIRPFVLVDTKLTAEKKNICSRTCWHFHLYTYMYTFSISVNNGKSLSGPICLSACTLILYSRFVVEGYVKFVKLYVTTRST